ncbi:transmembrane emp24 domain-containing protein p24delta3-like [Dorcoceras hygrometricum]|uniref:Transmembrane emp24 domain-containing protein p24delta3-like n=1 Tax=Dorcoceras hygrometricum TaxID=472368 RepID=A0A2Z7BKF5_9LAMI|nr:transmembrane emp24 domain-containing protein p24delta3-like [Dorcoceras hygrometricum]
MKLVEAVIVLVVMIPAARGLWLNLPSTGTKCVSEELHNNVVVLGDYHSFFGEQDHLNNTSAPAVSVKVTSPYGTELYHQEQVSHGQFAFTASETGSYTACFTVDGDHHGGKIVTVGIDWKTGIAAKDWDSVARKEKGLELELTKLEGIVQAIHENLKYLVSREAGMREVSEKTNSRVVWFSIVALGACIAATIFQLWYLRRYFQKKKLI